MEHCAAQHIDDARCRPALHEDARPQDEEHRPRPWLGSAFDHLVAYNAGFAQRAHELRDLWPVFKTGEARERNVAFNVSDARVDIVRAHRDAGVKEFEPQCSYDHASGAPLDWRHALMTIYRVRNNLFHGEKARTSENDAHVVNAAHAVLHAFIAETKLFE